MRNESSTITSGLRHWLAVAAVAVLAACGSPAGNGNTAPPAEPPPAPAQAAPQAAAPAAAPAPAAAAPAAVQESAAPEAGSGGEQLKLASAAAAANETKWRYQEGQDFKVLTAAQGTTGAPGKIEVVEVFWYGCPHCYQFDPTVTDWAKKLPGDVNFGRLPVMWNPTNQIHARIFYTAVALGKIDTMHSAIFHEIHVNKKMLTEEDEIQEFFGTFGVSASDFKKTFRSFAVEGQLARAKDLTQRYQVRSVPLLIVDGKYSTDAPGIKSYDNMFAVTDELIERERHK
jgi:protein dithiol oxidoreductase (disulfide-forming)